MGAMDEAKHEGQELVGKAKEKVGDATDDHSLQAEGLVDQAKAKVSKAGDAIRDVIRGRDHDDDANRSER